VIKRSSLFALVGGLLFVGVAGAQQFPIMDMVADKVIAKYQSSSCETLWADKGKPKGEKEQEAMAVLRSNPEMRAAFFNKISGPVLNKMFECGMVP
jgi:hypothetical protein